MKSPGASPRACREAPARRGHGLLLVLLIACAICVTSCGGRKEKQEPSDPVRVLLLAVDGLEWEVVLELLRQGRMPELADLMEGGTYGLLETMEPTRSPVIWTTVATGKTKEKHGILAFDFPDPTDPSARRLYSNSERRTKAFWNILSDYDRRVALIGWFVTFPVEPVNGVMVAQTNDAPMEEVRAGTRITKGSLVEGVPGQVHPPERQPEMMEVLRESDRRLPTLVREIFGELEVPVSPQPLGLLKTSEWAFRADATYAAIARKLALGDEAFDVMAVYIGGTDVVGHRFWRYMKPESFEHPPPEHDVQAFGRVIPDYYAHTDRVIGDIRRAVGSDATVFVISDHGMKAVNTSRRFGVRARGIRAKSGGHPDGRPHGVLVAAGPGIRPTDPHRPVGSLRPEDLPVVGSVLDIAPTLLALLDLPVGEDMDGRVLTNVLVPEFLSAHPVRTVPTHDTSAWLAARPTIDRQAPDEDERMEQLRELGYIE